MLSFKCNVFYGVPSSVSELLSGISGSGISGSGISESGISTSFSGKTVISYFNASLLNPEIE